jgi:hypothetical protein
MGVFDGISASFSLLFFPLLRCPARRALRPKAFREFAPLLHGQLGYAPFGLGVSAGGDTSHVLGGLVELRCCAGCLLRAGHGYQRTPAGYASAVLDGGADVCTGGVNQPRRHAEHMAVSN